MKSSIEFANRLIELRKRNGWSQEDLGNKLDVSRQAISKWENGESMPEIDKLINMSKLYNLTLEELLYGRVEPKVIEVKAENIIESRDFVNEDEDYNNKITDMIPISKLDVKRKSFIRRYFPKIIAAIIAIVLACYLILCAYRFSILKEINDKFNEYKNVDNCYYERTEVMTNDAGTAYIVNSKYWYKDGILKVENKRMENGKTEVTYMYIDSIKQERYILFEKNKTGIKQTNKNEIEEFKDGILQYVIGDNYHKSTIDMIKFILSIYKINMSKDENNYIIESKYDIYIKNIYDIESGIIKQNYIINDNGEEIKILHKLETNIVKDEDIQSLDLEKYTIVNK